MKNRITTNIAFDVDEVMVKFVDAVIKQLRLHGYELGTMTDHDITKFITPEIPKKVLYTIFGEVYEQPGQIEIIDGAQKLCTTLYVKTADPIIFITMRPIQYATETHILVKRFCKVPYVLIFSDPAIGKLPYLNEIGFFADDRRKTIMELAAAGKTVFVPIRPWNTIRNDFEYEDSIIPMKSLTEISDHLNMFTK